MIIVDDKVASYDYFGIFDGFVARLVATLMLLLNYCLARSPFYLILIPIITIYFYKLVFVFVIGPFNVLVIYYFFLLLISYINTLLPFLFDWFRLLLLFLIEECNL